MARALCRWLARSPLWSDRSEIDRLQEAKLLPADHDSFELNLRIQQAGTWLLLGSLATIASLTILTTIALLNFGLDRFVVPAMATGLTLLIVAIIAVIPVSRSIGRHMLRKELARLGIAFCRRCGYDCRAIEATRCPECGTLIGPAE